MSLDARLQSLWYGRKGLVFWLLSPLAGLFALISSLRRWAFKFGVSSSVRVERPVVVVGNITVGGTGKTPLTIWLVNRLSQQGRRVGVIARGYGGRSKSWPLPVTADSDPRVAGDEAVLIARQCPDALVFAGPDRVADAQHAIAAGADLIVSDDGLQHYRLQRDVELAVVDGARGFGNGGLLPAGPLREPVRRLRQVQFVLINERGGLKPEFGHDLSKSESESELRAAEKTLRLLRLRSAQVRSANEIAPLRTLSGVEGYEFPAGVGVLAFSVAPVRLRSLASGITRPLDAFKRQRVHVVTGIGHPAAFIASLRQHGMDVDARLLRDHAAFTRADIDFPDDLPVLMTEKDAVKCAGFADPRHWAVEADVVMDDSAVKQLLDTVQRLTAKH